eukprot:359462-Chlamydomonas_euryale.AAC.2
MIPQAANLRLEALSAWLANGSRFVILISSEQSEGLLLPFGFVGPPCTATLINTNALALSSRLVCVNFFPVSCLISRQLPGLGIVSPLRRRGSVHCFMCDGQRGGQRAWGTSAPALCRHSRNGLRLGLKADAKEAQMLL